MLLNRMEAVVELGYWLRRHREELALANGTTCAKAKTIHFDLAARYSVKASEEALWLRTSLTEAVRDLEPMSNVLEKFGTARPTFASVFPPAQRMS